MKRRHESNATGSTALDAVLYALDQRTSTIAQRMRETAAGLRAGTINPHHAANRLERLANEIRKETR